MKWLEEAKALPHPAGDFPLAEELYKALQLSLAYIDELRETIEAVRVAASRAQEHDSQRRRGEFLRAIEVLRTVLTRQEPPEVKGD